MKRIIINPLGWNNDILFKLNLENIDYIINFNNLDSDLSLEKKVEQEIENILLLTRTDEVTFYAFSYGGMFLNYILENSDKVVFKTSKIYYYDSFSNQSIPTKEELFKFRCDSYNNKDNLLSDYLNDDEIKDQKLKELIIGQFSFENKKYIHHLSNDSFSEYINIDVSNMFIFISKGIDYKIYNSEHIENVEYTKIAPEDHLIMITDSKRLQKDLDDKLIL